MLMFPLLPASPLAWLAVCVLMMEPLPEKEMLRSRGVEALRLISPPLLVLVAVAAVLSWEPPDRLRAAASTVMEPPAPAAELAEVALLP